MSLTDTYTMKNGLKIPIIGFGTWQTPDGEIAEKSVKWALEAGYRHIDTATAYKNEESVGRAIKNSSINREELFITSKLWNRHNTYEKAREGIDDSLQKLDLDYMDLYLIHWPNSIHYRENWKGANANRWRAMEEAVKAGKIRSIGVSNFRSHHLDALLETAEIEPVVNQIFLNPSDMQEEVVNYNKTHGIISEAYSPLGTGKIFEVEELKELAEKYDRTIAQIVLRWSIQHHFLPLPKTVHEDRVYENANIFDFNISKEDMEVIDGLKGKAGVAQDPDKTEF